MHVSLPADASATEKKTPTTENKKLDGEADGITAKATKTMTKDSGGQAGTGAPHPLTVTPNPLNRGACSDILPGDGGDGGDDGDSGVSGGGYD